MDEKNAFTNNKRFIAFEFGLTYIYTSLYRLFAYIPILHYLTKLVPEPNSVLSDNLKPLNITKGSSKAVKDAVKLEAINSQAGLIDSATQPSFLPMEPENTEAKDFTNSLFKKSIIQIRKIVSKPSTENGSEISTDSIAQISKSENLPHESSISKTQKPKNISAGSFIRKSFDFGKRSTETIPKTPQPAKTLKKKILVLDLDETLIHSSPHSSYKAHLRIEVIIEKMACLYYVYKRPYVDYFLRKVSEWYKVVVFTASIPEYANSVINFLDPKGTLISSRLFRDSCIPHNFSYAKDLKIVSPDLSQVILVDNSPISYFINQENAVPIQAWINNDPKDECLLDLLPFLDALRFTDDVRSILSLRIL
ncbi:hypothetical protein BB559_003745 [Furculomyces boomerangus]|uniref:FCP1 homology domain-containing protein n=2 Tax=Harpellales TaxID=61421 RepID=A0A2T9YJ29_9FUNG|nr:hypothetical protein BB559_005648 [Furculomyces boomerangus]PVU92348.1 hypothetical protein BB559_003745 [Furculomyces boomerangus]PWA02511.1 hypothetical protein BB558_001397 [Smittium angustum]